MGDEVEVVASDESALHDAVLHAPAGTVPIPADDQADLFPEEKSLCVGKRIVFVFCVGFFFPVKQTLFVFLE